MVVVVLECEFCVTRSLECEFCVTRSRVDLRSLLPPCPLHFKEDVEAVGHRPDTGEVFPYISASRPSSALFFSEKLRVLVIPVPSVKSGAVAGPLAHTVPATAGRWRYPLSAAVN